MYMYTYKYLHICICIYVPANFLRSYVCNNFYCSMSIHLKKKWNLLGGVLGGSF